MAFNFVATGTNAEVQAVAAARLGSDDSTPETYVAALTAALVRQLLNTGEGEFIPVFQNNIQLKVYGGFSGSGARISVSVDAVELVGNDAVVSSGPTPTGLDIIITNPA